MIEFFRARNVYKLNFSNDCFRKIVTEQKLRNLSSAKGTIVEIETVPLSRVLSCLLLYFIIFFLDI